VRLLVSLIDESCVAENFGVNKLLATGELDILHEMLCINDGIDHRGGIERELCFSALTSMQISRA